MAARSTSDAGLAIGEVAERSGLRTSAIRYYERVGVLPVPERVNGRRRYQPDVLRLLAAIEVSKAAGFSLAEIMRLFRDSDPSTAPSERWRSQAAAKLAELDLLAARIESMRAVLREGLECGCLSLEDCSLISERTHT
jgi:MerR family redox-sensitive transcriptional activator SoxR